MEALNQTPIKDIFKHLREQNSNRITTGADATVESKCQRSTPFEIKILNKAPVCNLILNMFSSNMSDVHSRTII
jgi:hypothetical protein